MQERKDIQLQNGGNYESLRSSREQKYSYY